MVGVGLVVGGVGDVVGGSGDVVGGSGDVVGGSGEVVGGSGEVVGGSGEVVGGTGDVVGSVGSVVTGGSVGTVPGPVGWVVGCEPSPPSATGAVVGSGDGTSRVGGPLGDGDTWPPSPTSVVGAGVAPGSRPMPVPVFSEVSRPTPDSEPSSSPGWLPGGGGWVGSVFGVEPGCWLPPCDDGPEDPGGAIVCWAVGLVSSDFLSPVKAITPAISITRATTADRVQPINPLRDAAVPCVDTLSYPFSCQRFQTAP
ncbi:hypothetical protein CGZ98_17880 [Enemella evansiae]|nr:hypothetical protein CGZ98_17880 [Enemella evansiae]OYO12360.1 hypothetical protein BI335_14175 [Enemella evansiae]